MKAHVNEVNISTHSPQSVGSVSTTTMVMGEGIDDGFTIPTIPSDAATAVTDEQFDGYGNMESDKCPVTAGGDLKDFEDSSSDSMEDEMNGFYGKNDNQTKGYDDTEQVVSDKPEISMDDNDDLYAGDGDALTDPNEDDLYDIVDEAIQTRTMQD